MYILLNSSKTMTSGSGKGSEPIFLSDAKYVVDNILFSNYFEGQGLSGKILREVRNFYSNWSIENHDESAEAIRSFTGTMFSTLTKHSFDIKEAGKRVFILSALYGILRASDCILPYRLDLNDKLKIDGKSLLSFWKTKIRNYIINELSDAETILNLTSSEYGIMLPKEIVNRIVTPKFLILKNGKYSLISTFSKQARGELTGLILSRNIHEVKNIESLKFNGFEYSKEFSKENEPVFVKKIFT
ncbi:MAG: peroxide stress protein YaaA [Candidatus Delongbacteria bacterium]|nr:peroxide stress protein YaaA [Candidatus Delongbacteria bacterium]MBN2835266.1 peroxide stress protein YaaA [Candidatus Delongbacteria bacterium]